LRDRRKWKVIEIFKPPQTFSRALDPAADKTHDLG
jgi:hypothetical protein